MTSPIRPLKILLIENDPAAATEIRAALTAGGGDPFEVEWVRQLSDGLERLNKKGIAAVLLELSLPDSGGIETFDKLFSAAPDVPILILGGNANEALAKEAVGRGAQDYLLPGHLDAIACSRQCFCCRVPRSGLCRWRPDGTFGNWPGSAMSRTRTRTHRRRP